MGMHHCSGCMCIRNYTCLAKGVQRDIDIPGLFLLLALSLHIKPASTHLYTIKTVHILCMVQNVGKL